MFDPRACIPWRRIGAFFFVAVLVVASPLVVGWAQAQDAPVGAPRELRIAPTLTERFVESQERQARATERLARAIEEQNRRCR